MKTPKALYASARMIYHPELSSCPLCGGPIALANYLLWDKTIQTLDAVLSVASRPGACADPTCPGATMRLRSAAGQQVALPHTSYGLDVLVRIGWARQEHQTTFGDIQAALAPQVVISEAHVRHLYHQFYLPLLACHEQQQGERLAQAAKHSGGLVLALDGLAPEGGEPQLWCLRELLTGLVLRSGWLSRQDQAAFEAFLLPLRTLALPIRAIVSDKQRGLVPAIATVLPNTPHQYCQPHYLRNLAEPLAALDSAMNVTLRAAVRTALGPMLRAERPPDPAQPGVLTMTGLLAAPDLLPSTDQVPTPASVAAPLDAEPIAAALPKVRPTDAEASAEAQLTDHLVTQLFRRTRYLLTLKGRPPLRLAGLSTYAGLLEVAELSATLLAHRQDPRLSELADGLAQALSQVAPTIPDLHCGAGWLTTIAATLTPTVEPARSSAQVAQELEDVLAQLSPPDESALLQAFRQHLLKVSRSYWPGLFYCYDHPDIPRTNNGMESHFRETQRRLLRTTGQRGQTRRSLHRVGAWELIPRPASEAACRAAFGQIAPATLAREQQRMRDHQERFRLHTRSQRQTTAQLERLRQQWLSLPGTSTG
jgi:Transposase, Mutator family